MEVFPAPEEAVKVNDATVAPAAAGETRVRFRAAVLKGQTPKGRSLPVVVACEDDKGEWRGVRVEFPLDQSGAR